MSRIILGNLLARVCRVLPTLAAVVLLASCAGNVEIAPHLRPLPTDAMMLLGKKGMDVQAPIFVRIFKEESELEVWKQRDDGRFYHFKTYPICNWSGELGPKVRQGDRQAPEGFYAITREQMNLDLQRMWLAARNTVLFITHSIEEAVLLSDRVVVMSSRPGRIADIVLNDLPRPRGAHTRSEPRSIEHVERIRRHFLARGVLSES